MTTAVAAGVVGQAAASEALRRAVANDEVGHAFLLVGQEGVGQRELVGQLAAALNCDDPRGAPAPGLGCGACTACGRILRGAHPNVVTHRPVGAFHLVDAVREEWIPAAARTLVEGRRRVVHVVAADRMNEPAQNAFLKALEEPPASTVWVLDAGSTGPLLDTIVSRCRRLDLRAWAMPDLVARATALGVADEQRARVLARAAQGSPTRLAEFVHDLWEWTCPACDQVTRLHGVVQASWPTACSNPKCDSVRDGEPAPLQRSEVDATARERHLRVVERFRTEGAAAVSRIASEVAGWADERARAVEAVQGDEWARLVDQAAVERPADLPASIRTPVAQRHKREGRQARLAAIARFLDDFGSYLRDLVAVAAGAEADDLVNPDIHARLVDDAEVVDAATALAALADLPQVREAVIVHSAQPQLQLERVLMPIFVDVFAASTLGR